MHAALEDALGIPPGFLNPLGIPPGFLTRWMAGGLWSTWCPHHHNACCCGHTPGSSIKCCIFFCIQFQVCGAPGAGQCGACAVQAGLLHPLHQHHMLRQRVGALCNLGRETKFVTSYDHDIFKTILRFDASADPKIFCLLMPALHALPMQLACPVGQSHMRPLITLIPAQ